MRTKTEFTNTTVWQVWSLMSDMVSTLLQRSRNMGKGKGVITVDGKVATEATLSFLLVPRKTEG